MHPQESLQLWSMAGALLICSSTLTVALLEQRRVKSLEASRLLLATTGGTAAEREVMLGQTSRAQHTVAS